MKKVCSKIFIAFLIGLFFYGGLVLAVPTVSWDETNPSGSQAKSLGDDRIRELKTQLREVIAVDHEMASSGSTATTGQHKQVTLQEQADLGTGAVGATILGSQTVDGKGELVYTDEDDNDVQITSGGKVIPGADTVTGAKIADDAADSEHYTDGSIDKAHLAADIIDGTKIGDDVVNSEHYAAGSMDAEHLAADIIDETKLADDSLDSEHYNDGSIDEAHLAAGAVAQAKLKTSQGEVSLNSGNTDAGLHDAAATSVNTLPGGEYGFYPRIKVVETGSTTERMAALIGGLFGDLDEANYKADSIIAYGHGSSYITNITLLASAKGGTGTSATAYAQQRYITASGEEHWIFLLTEKATGKIVCAWQAPDHPSYGQGGDENEIPHPFGVYDETKHEVVLIDNEILTKLKDKITRKKSLLTLVNEEYEIDIASNPVYEPREIIEIDEWGDMEGEVLGEFDTPDWAKIKIKKDKFTLKKRMVNTLPEMIKYRKLKKK